MSLADLYAQRDRLLRRVAAEGRPGITEARRRLAIVTHRIMQIELQAAED